MRITSAKHSLFSAGAPALPRASRPMPRHPRGMALLLVMIGLVVCSILTAGFLSSQGTAIGIARNERDAEQARAVAQSGIDMCYWQMRNRTDWRTAMTPGLWVNAAAVGNGTVSVNAASADGATSFAADPTQPVILTSTATVDGRTFTLTATLGPTGGGTVYRGGNFTVGRITLGSNDLSGAAVIDSYNSSVAPYNALLPGSNAAFGTNYTGNDGLMIYFLSVYRGTFAGSSSGSLLNAVYETLGAIGPVSTSQALQPYIPGTVVLPNTTGLTAQGTYSRTSGANLGTPGTYTSFTLGPTLVIPTTVNINASGIYHITGDLTIKNLANLSINDGINATIIVDGNASITGNIKLSGSGTLALYVAGSTTLTSGATINLNGNTSNFTLLGTGSGAITLNGTSQLFGAIYAPQSAVRLQNLTPQVYGAIISNTLTLTDLSSFHFDQNLQNKRIDNLINGSAPPGTADYNLSILGATTVTGH